MFWICSIGGVKHVFILTKINVNKKKWNSTLIVRCTCGWLGAIVDEISACQEMTLTGTITNFVECLLGLYVAFSLISQLLT
jgi:hypothetical protein